MRCLAGCVRSEPQGFSATSSPARKIGALRLVSDAATADAAGRNQLGNVVNARRRTARTGPYINTPAGRRALLMALRDRVNEQRQVISAYKARDAKLAAMVRQLVYRRSAGAVAACRA